MVWQNTGNIGFWFGKTNGANGFVVRQPLDTMIFQWFMVANHWSEDGMILLLLVKLTIAMEYCQHTNTKVMAG